MFDYKTIFESIGFLTVSISGDVDSFPHLKKSASTTDSLIRRGMGVDPASHL